MTNNQVTIRDVPKQDKPIHIRVKDEAALKDFAREMLHILVNLRYSTKEWNEHFGGPLAKKKREWERKADELLEKHSVESMDRLKEITIKIENQTT